MSKQKEPIYVTPAGMLQFPHLSKPDTKFVPEGIYSTKVVLAPCDALKNLINIIDTACEDSVRAALKENQKLKPNTIKIADKPYVPETDDDGNETGSIVFNTKCKAVVKSKKNGETFKNAPDLFDSRNVKLDRSKVYPYSGTIARVAFEAVAFYTALLGAGVTLRLKAVQILSLVEGGGRSAEDYGFDTTEDGYSSEENAGFEDDDLPF